MDDVRTRYRFELSDKTESRRGEQFSGGEVVIADGMQPHARRIRELASSSGSQSIVFQSLTVASLQALEKVLIREREVAAAAISLAQGEKLRDMIESLEAVLDALHATLSAQGTKMLHMVPERASDAGSERSWWFTLTEALQSLDDGIQRIASVVSGQPKGGPARTLSSVIVRLLRQHHQQLLDEAEHWIT